jgi:hypothetical protein
MRTLSSAEILLLEKLVCYFLPVNQGLSLLYYSKDVFHDGEYRKDFAHNHDDFLSSQIHPLLVEGQDIPWH